MKKWLKELRVTHYLKNCLLFVPAFFGGTIFESTNWVSLISGFVSFCMGASVVYLINDIKDIEKDRKHPQKKDRPIAAGEITIISAIIVAVGLLVLSYAGILIFVADVARTGALFVFSCYLCVNILYSIFGWKKVPLVDVALLVSGFYLRVLMGAVITGNEISAWLYLVIISGAFYLAFGKRRNELKFLGNEGRDVLSGYTETFLDKAMYSCMTMANIFFALWCIQIGDEQKYIILVPILMLICYKYSMDVEQDKNDGDPMNVILHDKVLLGMGLVFIVIILGLIYW